MANFCKSITKRFNPVVVKREYSNIYMGYFLIRGNLYRLRLATSSLKDGILTLNRWLIEFIDEAKGNYSCGPCSVCSCRDSYVPKGETLGCMVCGHLIR